MKKKILLCSLVLFAFGVTNVFSGGQPGKVKTGVVKEWRGTIDSSWYNPANWLPAGVPEAADSVVIPTDATKTPVLDPSVNGQHICTGLNIESDETKATGGGSMKISGEVVVDGSLTVSKLGSFVHLSGWSAHR